MKYFILLQISIAGVSAFTIGRCTSSYPNRSCVSAARITGRDFISTLRTDSSLFSTPQKRIARRDLKKRTRRKRVGYSKVIEEKSPIDGHIHIETRPLIRAKKIEAGEDYWIEEDELQKYSEREQAIKNRKAMEGEISQEKLKDEVVAPYKQNWIGLISVGIIVLAVIVHEFPELLNSPLIPIPDL